MTENGREQRLSAAQDVHAAIAAIRKATLGISKEDDPCLALIAIRKADDAVQVAKKSWSEADRNATQAWVYHRKIDDDDSRSWFSEVQGELDDATLMLRKARGARRVVIDKSLDTIDAFLNDIVISLNNTLFRKDDHCQALLKDWDAKRKAEAEEAAEKARDPRSKSDYAVLNAIKATLKEQDTDLVRIRHADIVAKLKDDLNRKREEYQASGRDPADIDQQLHSLANIPKVLDSVRHLNKLGDITVYPGKKNYNVYELGPGDVSAPVEEPELSPWSVEPGTCQMCGEPTDLKSNGEPWPRCKPCQFGGNKKPEPDDSGTLFEKPEPAPVPVPASTVMLDAKPVKAKPAADDLAKLIRAPRQAPAALTRIGHWHSKRFTVAVAAQLPGKENHSKVALLRGIMTVLEGLGVDSARISNGVLTGTSGVATPYQTANYLDDDGFIVRVLHTGTITEYRLASGFASTLEGDTSAHSTRFTVGVNEQLTSDSVLLAPRNVLWACMAVIEGISGDFAAIHPERIADVMGASTTSVQHQLRELRELEYVDYRRSLIWGLGPKLTNQ